MKIAICEDEVVQLNYISSLINAWKIARKTEIKVDSYSSAENFLFAEISDYDLLILDVQMGEMDGISLAKEIRKTNQIVKIIFITAILDFISEGYEVDALHYLLKPVGEEKLFALLDKANITLPEEFILIEQRKLNLKEIFYIESIGHKVKMKLECEELLVNKKFSDLLIETKLFLCHRSFAVNISHIKNITKTDIILDNNEKIPVSRRLRKETCNAFTSYFGEKIYEKF